MRETRVRLIVLLGCLLLWASSAWAQGTILSSGACPTAAQGVTLNPGQFCWRADTRVMFVWDGATWQQLVTIASDGSLTLPNLTTTGNTTTPVVIGGTAAGSDLTLRATSGAGSLPGADIIVQTGTDGGTEIARFRYSSAGLGANLGIGTASPGANLHVQSPAATNATVIIAAPTTNRYSYVQYVNNVNAIVWQAGAAGAAASDIPSAFFIYDGIAAAYRVVIDSSGRVLLGYDVNQGGGQRLQVNGAALFGGAIVAPTIGPAAAQQHTLPAVTSDTVTLNAATQTLSGKTLVAPELGTPASGVATNLTGTAAGLTAGNVTTNANLTGPVTSVGNATTITANAVTNAMAAQMANNTVKCRVTAGTGNPEDCTRAQVSSVLASATLTATPANPTGTTSTTGVMMGLGASCTITPAYSTKVSMIISGSATNNTINDGVQTNLRFGTGSAPANGAALTGTIIGAGRAYDAALAGGLGAITHVVVATGLTAGTAYWFDLGLAARTAGTASIANVECFAWEIA